MKRALSILSPLLFLLYPISLLAQLAEPTPPVNVIIDSDMAENDDDVGDQAVLWALQNRGEVNVLAVIADSANDYSAPAMHAIATYYGHGDVPIGAHKGNTPTLEASNTSPYAQQITNQFGTPGDTRFNYPDAVTVYRQALANAPDQSVYIINNGYFQPMRDLLQSPPDSISPLSGIELVRQKVRRFVCSAGVFPSGSEHNFRVDADAASYVFANWPGEIVSVGSEVGGDVLTGPSPSSDPNTDPVKAAYTYFDAFYGRTGTAMFAWGQVATLYAVRGGLGTNFTIGGYNGQTTVLDNSSSNPGYNSWSSTPSVGHSYLEKQISAAQMSAILNPLLQSSSNMPILRNISPSSVVAGSPASTITLNGTNFFNDSQVAINGSTRTTTFVSGTQLNVQLNSNDVGQPGSQPLAVVNSSEGNWTSNKINLSIVNAVPSLSSISPSSVVAGGSGFTLTANGNGFVSGSVIQVNGASRASNFVSGSQLTTMMSASDIAAGGYLSITVATPAPGGGTSASVTLTVNNPVPAISNVSPSLVIATSSNYTLTISGGGFNQSSIVNVDGRPVSTTLVSPTQLTAQVPNNDLLLGQHSITVSNPAPGGGKSNAVTVTTLL
jgi:inosine-uridine nucleoside N-ribohydrolase